MNNTKKELNTGIHSLIQPYRYQLNLKKKLEKVPACGVTVPVPGHLQ